MLISKKALHQTLATSPVNLIRMMCGIGSGWTAPTLNQMKNAHAGFSLSVEECVWVASLYFLGKILGPWLTAAFLDTVGRSRLVVACAVICFAMWPALLYTRSVFFLCATRVAFGVATGMFSATASVYMGEICSPQYRGIQGAVHSTCFSFGLIVAVLVSGYLSYDTAAEIYSVLGFVTLMSTFLLKETPHFLLMNEQHRKAEENFRWLQASAAADDGGHLRRTFDEIEQNIVEEKRKRSWSLNMLTEPQNYRSLRLVVMVGALSSCTGYTAINAFIMIILTSTKTLSQNRLTAFICLGHVLMFCTSPVVVRRYDRRSLFLWAAALTGLVNGFIACLYYVNEQVTPVPHFPSLLLAAMAAYTAIVGITLIPLCTIIRGEVLPQSVKAIGSCLTVSVSSGVSLIVTEMFLRVEKECGQYVNFGFYSVSSIILYVYIYLDLPETRNKSLVEIQTMLKRKSVKK